MSARRLPPSLVTALYRFFGPADELLYIGISNSIPRRFDQHEDTKPWFTQVTRVAVEHHPTRADALVAEERAIKSERPKYNIQHNRRSGPVEPVGAGGWTFSSLRSGYERTTELYLYPELDCSSMVDDHYELDGEGQLAAYVRYLEKRYPQWLEADAVPILWTVVGNGVCEFAPFQVGEMVQVIPGRHLDFLTEFTWPYDERSGEDLDWFKLPVRNTRFPEFAAALDWTPSPMQPTCPLRSILRSRSRIEPLR